MVLDVTVTQSYRWRDSLAVELGDPEGWHSLASASRHLCFSLVQHEPATQTETHIYER